MPDPTTTTFEYDAAGRQSAVTAADGGRTVYSYDAWDRVIREEATIRAHVPAGLPINLSGLAEQAQTAVTERRYDSVGRLVEEKSPNGAWMRNVYDGNGQVVKQSQGGLVPSWNGTPLASGAADPLYPGNQVISSQSYLYDKLGRVVSETDGNGQTVTYSYSGRTVKTLTPTIGLNGNRVVVSSQTTYDTGGNVVRSVNEANGTTSVTYDAFGHTKLTINEEGQQISYVTDAYGRTKQRVEQVDRTGRTQTIAYSVDAWGNVWQEKRELNDGAWATTVSKYSPEGDLLQTTDPSGLVTDYAYDKHGRLQQSQETDRTTGSVRVTAYGYDVMGRRVAIWNDRSGLSYTNTSGFGLLKLAGR